MGIPFFFIRFYSSRSIMLIKVCIKLSGTLNNIFELLFRLSFDKFSLLIKE